jgi:hypothetical protein
VFTLKALHLVTPSVACPSSHLVKRFKYEEYHMIGEGCG